MNLKTISSNSSRLWLLLVLSVLVVSWGVSSAQETAATSELTVAEHQLGTSVENRVLKGAAESFAEGTQVFFWTRLVGGGEGERIRHVWVHDGKEVSVGLSIGAASWRTWSSKTLRPGSAGKWVVEVRDADGKVLASHEFTCTEAETPEAS